MPNKYELIKIGENRYKIRATKSFMTITGIKVEVGQLGGEVDSPDVLSQEGVSWIFANVQIFGNCVVDGNACILHSSVCPGASIKLHGNTIVTKCKFNVLSEVELFSGIYKNTTFAAMFSGSINVNGTVSCCRFYSKRFAKTEIKSFGNLSFFNCVFDSRKQLKSKFIFSEEMSVFKKINMAMFVSPDGVIFKKNHKNNLCLLRCFDNKKDVKLLLSFTVPTASICLPGKGICDLISKLPVYEYDKLQKTLQKLLSEANDETINKMASKEIDINSLYLFLCCVIGNISLLNNITRKRACISIFELAKINITGNKLISFNNSIDKEIVDSVLQ